MIQATTTNAKYGKNASEYMWVRNRVADNLIGQTRRATQDPDQNEAITSIRHGYK